MEVSGKKPRGSNEDEGHDECIVLGVLEPMSAMIEMENSIR